LLRYEVCPIFINEKLRKQQLNNNEKMWNCKESGDEESPKWCWWGNQCDQIMRRKE